MQAQKREDWEITWHIRLQVAVGYLRMTEATCRAMNINRVEAANRSINHANTLVKEHGDLGTSALSAAGGSLEALRAMACDGLVKTVGITRSSEFPTTSKGML